MPKARGVAVTPRCHSFGILHRTGGTTVWVRSVLFVGGQPPVTETLVSCCCVGATFEWYSRMFGEELTLVLQCSSCRRTLQISGGKSSTPCQEVEYS